jgi:hypothetical protein
MTSPEAAPDARPAAGLTKRLLELRPLLGLLLFVLYVLIRSAYSRFYAPFGLSPDDLGLSYLDLLAQSAIATLALPLLALVLVSSVTLLPFAGIELGNMSPRKAVLALIGVAVLVLLAHVDAAPARWIFAAGVATLFAVALNGVRRRLTSTRTLRGKPEGFWWRAALTILTIAALLIAAADLLSDADRDAQLVKRGSPAHLLLDPGVRLTSWGAEAATLAWTTTPADPTLRALGHACLMYLGQSGDTLFVYTPNQSRPATYRIPASEAAVSVFPGASCRPGAAQPML